MLCRVLQQDKPNTHALWNTGEADATLRAKPPMQDESYRFVFSRALAHMQWKRERDCDVRVRQLRVKGC